MRINDKIIKELAQREFEGRMPKELKAYLLDHYEDDPLYGELPEQFFWPTVLSDIQKYKAGDLDTAVRTPLQKLQDTYDELNDITCGLAEDKTTLEKENRYLRDFISWMHLEKNYQEFKASAHVEQTEVGFDFYTM